MGKDKRDLIIFIIVIALTAGGFTALAYYMPILINRETECVFNFAPMFVIDEFTSLNEDSSASFTLSNNDLNCTLTLSSSSPNKSLGSYDPYDYLYKVSGDSLNNLSMECNFNKKVTLINVVPSLLDDSNNDLSSNFTYNIIDNGFNSVIESNSEIILYSLTIKLSYK